MTRELRRKVAVPPVAFVGLGVLAFALATMFAWWTLGALMAGHALDRNAASLERSPAVLDGPDHHRKSVNVDWQVGVLGEIEVGPRASSELDDWRGDVVTAVRYRGEAVAVETPDGERYVSLGVGIRGAFGWGCLAVVAAGSAVGLLRHARRKRRVCGGWLRTDGPAVDAIDLPVALAVVVPGVCVLLMSFGAPWWLAAGLVLGGVAAVVIRVVRGHGLLRANPPRHARKLF